HKRFVHTNHGVARGEAQPQRGIPAHGVGHDARGFAAYFLSIRLQSEQHSPLQKKLRIADEKTAPVVTAYRKRRIRSLCRSERYKPRTYRTGLPFVEWISCRMRNSGSPR